MNKITSPLINYAESITLEELCLAPELPSLVTLDASLLAAINLLEFHTPPTPVADPPPEVQPALVIQEKSYEFSCLGK